MLGGRLINLCSLFIQSLKDFRKKNYSVWLCSQILIARDVGYITNEKYSEVNDQIVIANKLLNGLIKKTKSIIQDS